MSRVGKVPVSIPQGVQIEFKDDVIVIKGKLGELTVSYNAYVRGLISVVLSEDKKELVVAPLDVSRKEQNRARSMWGTVQRRLRNSVVGVVQGFSKRLEINGVGYRAACDGKLLSMTLGFSHEIRYAVPKGVTVQCEKPTLLVISATDPQLVGQVAADLMRLRPAEPYKGKGIYEEGSYIRRKEGKKK
jgi:large subunit ribosomal protein L6